MTNECVLTRVAPLVLINGEPSLRGSEIREVLEAGGWRVELARDQSAAATMAASQPLSLVLVDLDRSDCDADVVAATIRSLAAPCRAAPILGLTTRPDCEDDPKPSSVDHVISIGEGLHVLARELEHWRPVSLEATRRMAAMFGPGTIAGMIERLARRLEAALVSLNHIAQSKGGFDKAEAHRLAGLCGTLGFAQAHAAWLDLSHGDDTHLADVRRTTRLALAAIAQGL